MRIYDELLERMCARRRNGLHWHRFLDAWNAHCNNLDIKIGERVKRKYVKKSEDESPSCKSRKFIPLKMPGICGVTEENMFECGTGCDESGLDDFPGIATQVSEEIDVISDINETNDEAYDENEYEHEQNEAV